MLTTQSQLTQVFNDNFVAYYRSHLSHVNITGRNFASDHKLLEGIYEDLQGQIDTLAELLRTLGEYMPCEIQDVLNNSNTPTTQLEGDSEALLEAVRDDLYGLKYQYEVLMTTSNSEGLDEIANYAQDRILALAKHIWMLSATLD